MYFVYILENPSGRFYIGQTDHLARRLSQHNQPRESGCRKYSLKNGPWKLVWFETHNDRPSAVQRERTIKSMKSSRWIRENLLVGRSLVEQVPARRD